MKQTAVEWLKEQLECFGNKHELHMSWATVDELVEQAKQMEKEQIMLANGAGYKDGIMYSNGEQWLYESPEQYYNETYKKD